MTDEVADLMRSVCESVKYHNERRSRDEICAALDSAIENVREWIETFEHNEWNDPNYPEAAAIERRHERVLLWLRSIWPTSKDTAPLRCPAIAPEGHHFAGNQCGLHTGHAGEHTALVASQWTGP